MNLSRRSFRVLAASSLAAVALACGGSTPTPPQPPAARTSLPRDLTASERSVLNAANAFSFALWKEVNRKQPDSNVFVSPLSASFALGMTMNGAAGQTFDEMRGALQFGATPLADINSGYKSLIALLTTLDPSVKMEVANSIWYSKAFTFNQPFFDATRTWFDATVSPLDFAAKAAAMNTMNGWVSDKTHGRIPSIIDQINDDDVMFLMNAIYFKGSWRAKFDPALTQTAAFHAVGGDQSAKLMHREGTMSYAKLDGYQVVDLPYGDSAFTMTVILPDAGRSVESVAASLDASAWSALTSSLRGREVDLWLPKLKVEWKRDLIPDLRSLGMRAAFDDADFTPMSPRGRQLVISLVKQKTFVEIDEEGTEAAAVTAVGITVTSAPVVPVVRVDRPFIFAIRERLSGTVLFMGKIVKVS